MTKKNKNAAKAAAEEAKRLAEEAAEKAKETDDPEAKAAAEEAARKAKEAEDAAEKDDDDEDDDKPKKGTQPVLDSPEPFGIWIDYGKGPVLKRFLAGKTPLTPEEEAACKNSPYVKDNGAEVIYR